MGGAHSSRSIPGLARIVTQPEEQEYLQAQFLGAPPAVVPKVLDARLRNVEAMSSRSEERRVGKECRSRWSPYH